MYSISVFEKNLLLLFCPRIDICARDRLDDFSILHLAIFFKLLTLFSFISGNKNESSRLKMFLRQKHMTFWYKNILINDLHEDLSKSKIAHMLTGP